ncbi:MAG: exonuclease SbcCD subunit D C-terminal domain-containing protein, partial [Atopobiaceae bacterium]|nr:exonuclease SbcCD subunit D C-terminal domain-containing protein [Atopobiaceae bacterium]
WLIPFVRPADVRAWAAELDLDAGSVINYDTALHFVLDHVRAKPEFAARPNVCVAHQFVTNSGVSPERSDSEHLSLGTLDNVDYRAFEGFDYVALGHIHGPQRMGRDEVRYAGSPLKLSSSEIDQHKSFVVVGIRKEGGATRVKFKLVPVEPLRDFRKERGSVDELVRKAGQEDEARREDFVHAVVTDDDPIDVVARLRRVWPNLEQVTFDNAITRAAGATEVPTEVDLSKNMGDLFYEFFEAQTGKALEEDEKKLVDDALEKVLAKGGDVA